MAKVHLNPALNAISGEIDGLVFRRFRGKTQLIKKATFTKPWSEGTLATRKTFKAASEFGEIVKNDPKLLAAYKARGRRRHLNYRQMALRDAFHAPVISAVELGDYASAAGGVLKIIAYDDFEVIGVTVKLRSATGVLLAEGDATLRRASWHYEVPPAASPERVPATAEVAARDRPGNVTTQVVALPSNDATKRRTSETIRSRPKGQNH